MNVSVKNQPSRPPTRVELDGQAVTLPEQIASSLVAIRAYLEFLALQRRRVLSGFAVDGVEVRQIQSDRRSNAYRHVAADSITFEQLGERLIRTACRQLEQLSGQLEEATVRVLISERSQILVRWRSWQAQLRTPLVNLEFLRELWGEAVEATVVGGLSLAGHIGKLKTMLDEVDAIFLATESEWDIEAGIGLSNLLEKGLVPWLKVMEVFFLKLQHQPIP